MSRTCRDQKGGKVRAERMTAVERSAAARRAAKGSPRLDLAQEIRWLGQHCAPAPQRFAVRRQARWNSRNPHST